MSDNHHRGKFWQQQIPIIKIPPTSIPLLADIFNGIEWGFDLWPLRTAKEAARDDKLDAIIFDYMIETGDQPSVTCLKKWIAEFPEYEEELRDFTHYWFLCEGMSEEE